MTSETLTSVARRYWRVAVVAVLGGLLAFGGSFVVGPTYESSTRLLIRGRDSTVLNSTGESLAGQPGVIDSTLASALGETQGALVSSTAVAETVVDELNLDVPDEEQSGPIGAIKRFVAGTYKRTKAYLTHGFYEEPSDRQQAIDEVHAGLSAAPLGDSYVLELKGHADEAELAAEITDTAADALIEVTAARFRAEAAAERDFLAEQLQRAQDEVDAALDAKMAYETENGISQLPLELELDAVSLDDLRASLATTEVELDGARAELDAVTTQLARTPREDTNVSDIETGRSNTQISSSSTNPVYQQLVIRRDALESEVASLRARSSAIRSRIDGTDNTASNAQEAALVRLDNDLVDATENYDRLELAYQEALVTAERPGIELTRIDEASVPTFPIGPLRYLYLALGVLCGAVAGAALTWLRNRGEPSPDVDDEDWYGPGSEEVSTNGRHAPEPAPTEELVPVGTGEASTADRLITLEDDGTSRVRIGSLEMFQAPSGPSDRT